MGEGLTVLVTGASGFVGVQLVNRLLSDGYKVIASCRNKNDLNLDTHKNLQVIEYSLEQPTDYLDQYITQLDIIYHLAAYIPTNMSKHEYADKCFQINALGTLRLLEYSVKKSIRHFIYYSSGNAYKYATDSVKETSQLFPSHKATFYLASKLAGEFYVDHFRLNKNLNTTIFRLSSVYGRGMKKTEFISKCVAVLNSSGEIRINNNDKYMTDFVYVEDILQVSLLAVEKGVTGIYNVGSGSKYSLGNAARIIAKLLNKPKAKINIIENDCGEKIITGFSALDMTKTKQEFKICPTSLEAGLEKMIVNNNNINK